MGLFDKIKGNEEEVELKPSRRKRDYSFGGEEVEEEDEDEDEFLLPGMKSAEDSSGSKKTPETRKRGDDRMERLIEQNERIIELLEDMAGKESESEGPDMDTVL